MTSLNEDDISRQFPGGTATGPATMDTTDPTDTLDTDTLDTDTTDADTTDTDTTDTDTTDADTADPVV